MAATLSGCDNHAAPGAQTSTAPQANTTTPATQVVAANPIDQADTDFKAHNWDVAIAGYVGAVTRRTVEGW